jgi:hypothetical protein
MCETSSFVCAALGWVQEQSSGGGGGGRGAVDMRHAHIIAHMLQKRPRHNVACPTTVLHHVHINGSGGGGAQRCARGSISVGVREECVPVLAQHVDASTLRRNLQRRQGQNADGSRSTSTTHRGRRWVSAPAYDGAPTQARGRPSHIHIRLRAFFFA